MHPRPNNLLLGEAGCEQGLVFSIPKKLLLGEALQNATDHEVGCERHVLQLLVGEGARIVILQPLLDPASAVRVACAP